MVYFGGQYILRVSKDRQLLSGGRRGANSHVVPRRMSQWVLRLPRTRRLPAHRPRMTMRVSDIERSLSVSISQTTVIYRMQRTL